MKKIYEGFIVIAVLSTILWFASDGSLYKLVFGSSVIIIFFIYEAITAICSFGNDSQNLLQELMDINMKLQTLHSALSELKPTRSYSHAYDTEEE